MRFCIVGAGAIGGFVGAKLALAGEEVTFIARGKNLAAINEKGMSVFYRDGREEHATMARAEEDYAKAETPVVSNNSAHRWTPDVPMFIP